MCFLFKKLENYVFHVNHLQGKWFTWDIKPYFLKTVECFCFFCYLTFVLRKNKTKKQTKKTKKPQKTRKAIVLNKKCQLCPGSFRQYSSIDVFVFYFSYMCIIVLFSCRDHIVYFHFIRWAMSGENVSLVICKQQRPRSFCTSMQSDQGLHCPLTKSLDTTEYINSD